MAEVGGGAVVTDADTAKVPDPVPGSEPVPKPPPGPEEEIPDEAAGRFERLNLARRPTPESDKVVALHV